MKPMPDLDALLGRAVDKGVFGTKMRSVIKMADPAGVQAIVDQQFEVGRQILAAGLMPILEPEVDITSPQKAEAEALLRDALIGGLDSLADGQQVMFKLTLPEEDGFYQALVDDPRVLKVVGPVGRVQPRRSQRQVGPQLRGHRQLLAGAHRRAFGAAVRPASSIRRSMRRSPASTQHRSPDPQVSPR